MGITYFTFVTPSVVFVRRRDVCADLRTPRAAGRQRQLASPHTVKQPSRSFEQFPRELSSIGYKALESACLLNSHKHSLATLSIGLSSARPVARKHPIKPDKALLAYSNEDVGPDHRLQGLCVSPPCLPCLPFSNLANNLPSNLTVQLRPSHRLPVRHPEHLARHPRQRLPQGRQSPASKRLRQPRKHRRRR